MENTLTPEVLSPKQKEFIEKLIDDRDISVKDIDALLKPIKGKCLEELSKVEASALITFLLGRDRSSRRG